MKYKDYYQKQPNYTPPHLQYEDDGWRTCQDIQDEVIKRTGEFISLSKIGRVAKELGLSKNTGKGFRVYHKSLIEILSER